MWGPVQKVKMGGVDFEEILKDIGKYGKYQLFVCLLTGAGMFMVGFHTLANVFLSGVPEFWCESCKTATQTSWPMGDNGSRGDADICQDPCGGGMNTSEGDQVACSRWSYDPSIYGRTVVSQVSILSDHTCLLFRYLWKYKYRNYVILTVVVLKGGTGYLHKSCCFKCILTFSVIFCSYMQGSPFIVHSKRWSRLSMALLDMIASWCVSVEPGVYLSLDGDPGTIFIHAWFHPGRYNHGQPLWCVSFTLFLESCKNYKYITCESTLEVFKMLTYLIMFLTVHWVSEWSWKNYLL